MTPNKRTQKGALGLTAAVLLGSALAASEHGHTLVAGLLAMASAAVMFAVGVLVGYDTKEAEIAWQQTRESG